LHTLIKRVAIGLSLLLLPAGAGAQELTPGAYWPLPRGMNIVTVINSFNWGDVDFDPSVPVDQASARINTTALVYTRTLSIAGRSANIGLQLPIVGGHLEGLYLGAPAELDRFGLGDPRIVIGVNLYGAPTMTPKAFAPYRMRTLVGASLTVAPPLGQYDDTKVINLGTNRWSLKPEVGLSRASGHWIIELMAGVWLFTDNTDFIGIHTRSQDPIGSAQAPTGSANGSGSPPTPTFTRAAVPRSTASRTSTCRRTHASDRRSRGGSTRTTRCARRSAAAPTRPSAPTSRRSPLATTTPGFSSAVGAASQRTRLRWATAFSLMPRPKCAPSPIERSRRIMFTYGR
jgi:hypothetical protein